MVGATAATPGSRRNRAAALENTLRAWEELFPQVPGSGPRWLFLDEIQYVPDWQTCVKHQVDFQKHRRIGIAQRDDDHGREIHERAEHEQQQRYADQARHRLPVAEEMRARPQ